MTKSIDAAEANHREAKKNSRRSVSLHRNDDVKSNASDGRDERSNRRYLMHLITEKNEQIDQLIERVKTLHLLNSEFADEHKRLQGELSSLQGDYDRLIEKERGGCDSCRAHEERIKRLSGSNEQLDEDVATLKIVIFKLNAQIEHYQEKLRALGPEGSEALRQSLDNPSFELAMNSFWGTVNDHVLAPLLNSYEEIIADKSDLIKDQETEICRISGQLKSIVGENEQLHARLDELSRAHEQSVAEQAKMAAQLEVCKSKAEIHSKRADLAKEKLLEVLRCYEQKLQAQTIDMERLQEAYGRLKTEVGTCKTMHQNPEAVAANLRECEKMLNDLRVQHNEERHKIVEELKACAESKRTFEKEVQSQLLEIVRLKSESKSQSDIMSAYVKKVNSLRKRLTHMRLSRDHLKERVNSTVRNIEATTKNIRNLSYQDFHRVEQIIQQKDEEIRRVHIQYLAEVDKLQRKLNRRDESIKKILLNKLKTKNAIETKANKKSFDK